MRQQLQQYTNTVQFRSKQQHILLSDMASLMTDGVPLVKSLETIEQIHSGVAQRVAQSMLAALTTGQSLAVGMLDWFPVAVVELIRAGEEGGQLESALAAAVRYYQQQLAGQQYAWQALAYPLLVLSLAAVMLVVIKQSVLMNFAQIKPVIQWPMVGRHLFYLATVIQYGWWLILLFLGVLVFGVFYMMYQITGPFRTQLDRLPIMSLYRRRTAAQLLETLGLLIANGVSVQQALDILSRHAPPYLAWHLMLMEYRLGTGHDNIAEVLNTQLLDEEDMLRLRVVSLGKGFEQALVSLGRHAYQRYFQSVLRYTKVLAGCLLVTGAGMAAMMVLGIYSVGSVVAG